MPSWEFSIVVLVMGLQVSILKKTNGDRSNEIRDAQNEHLNIVFQNLNSLWKFLNFLGVYTTCFFESIKNNEKD